MSWQESLATLSAPPFLLFGFGLLCAGIARLFGLRLSLKGLLGGACCSTLSLTVSVTVIFFRWDNPDGAAYHWPVYDTLLVPPVLTIGAVVALARYQKWRFSWAAYLLGFVLMQLSAWCVYRELAAYFAV